MVNSLRRKMFKMGGKVPKSHGVGITSGMSYKKGGAVVKPGPDGKPRLHAKTGILADLITGGGTFAYRKGKELFDAIKRARSPIEKAGPKTVKGVGPGEAAGPGVTRALLESLTTRPGRTIGRAALTGTALGLPALAGKDLVANLLGFETRDMTKTPESIGELIGQVGTELGRAPYTTVAGLPFYGKDFLESENFTEALDALFGEGESYKKFYESSFGSAPPQFGSFGETEDTPVNIADTGAGVKDLKPQDIAEKIAELNKQRIEDDIEMYRSIMAEGDNTDKLATLGSALTQGGAALLSGQGYGAAASAFNQPLETARLTKEERDQLITSGAAEYALGNYATERALEDATLADLIKTGDLATAEQVQRYTLANKLSGGYVPVLPESTKDIGVLDADQLTGGTVYQNPKSLKTEEGTPITGLFVATNKKKTDAAGFDSLEKARAFAESEQKRVWLKLKQQKQQ